MTVQFPEAIWYYYQFPNIRPLPTISLSFAHAFIQVSRRAKLIDCNAGTSLKHRNMWREE